MTVRMGGRWTMQAAEAHEKELSRIDAGGAARARFELAALDALDTAGAWLVMRTAHRQQTLGTVDEQAAALGSDARLAIGDARQLMAELGVTARALSATGEAVNEVIAENREPIADFTQDGLYEFSSMIDEIRILVTSLTRIAEQLEADPSGYLLGGSQQGFEAE